MRALTDNFANYCCELLAGVGPCTAKRMFGGFGISSAGLTIAIVADLGEGERLWLKADAQTSDQFEAAGCQRFTYAVTKNGSPATHSLNYYSAPDDAMDSAQAMLPWARVSLECALKARASPKARKKTAPKASPTKARRPPAKA